MANVTVPVPEFAGTRWAAQELTSELSVGDLEVTVDFAATRSAAQGFCDELVGQLLTQSTPTSVAFVNVPQHAAAHLERAARLRGCAIPHTITVRAE